MKYRYTITIAADPVTYETRESLTGECRDYELTDHVIIIKHKPGHFEVYGLASIVSISMKPIS
jgi:hypothetical protein